MKLKLLLLFIGFASLLGAQVPYDSTLIISEVSGVENQFNNTYIELTNVGTTPIDLADMKFAKMAKGNANCTPEDGRWMYKDDNHFYLPESVTKVLQPGESYVMTVGLDFLLNGYQAGIPEFRYGDRDKNHNIYPLADFIAHREERFTYELYGEIRDSAIYSADSAWDNNDYVFTIGHLQLDHNGFFIEQHFLDDLGQPDSIVIDQVRCGFSKAGCTQDDIWWDVAGLYQATRDAVLFRQKDVTKGNLDWDDSRGNDLSGSEWIAIRYPQGWDNWRDYWWTVGNHSSNVLDATTLVPKAGENITVDFAGKTITAPWGIRRLDDLMRRMEYKEGVAWVHILNGNPQDSLLRSLQSGDRLAVYVIGETLTADTFDISVNVPLDSDNIVIPIDHKNNTPGTAITGNAQSGKLDWPRITANGPGVTDTISGAGRGLPFNMRIDTLFKYLERAPEATLEIDFVDGQARADLKSGDKLKVTAKSGAVKEYLIEVRGFEPSDNTNLASITWPDISLNPLERFKYGWPETGDTIPGFFVNTNYYRLKLPSGTSIPAFVAKPENLNSKVTLDRAWTLNGSIDDRTTTFTVTAENDSTQTYSVELEAEMDASNMQPWNAEPFVSQYIHMENNNNVYAEICNPGTEPLDLSYYMITYIGNIPEAAISQSFAADSASWASNRFKKYIPGRKWLYYDEWAVKPNTLDSVPDNVYPIIEPGGVFVLGYIRSDIPSLWLDDPSTWDIEERCDAIFSPGFIRADQVTEFTNTWDEPMGRGPMSTSLGKDAFYIFKILNDSVRHGQKPATDVNDFELIEVLAMANYMDKWYPTGRKITQNDIQTRKPEYVFPNPVAQASFASNDEDSEWIYFKSGTSDNLANEGELGEHFFNPYTGHMSIIKSPVYIVSPGYSMKETLEGVLTGTTLDDFMANVYKVNEGQTMLVKSGQDTLETGQAISLNDSLVVVSADGTGTTWYGISINSEGLSNDALLVSEPYDITVDGNTGSVAAMEFSTTLTEVVNNVTVPEGAILTVVDANDGYVPYKKLSIIGTYFDATANTETYFDVLAENKSTRIVYQLQPTVADDTVFVVSDLYDVSQDLRLISFVPFGTSYATFMNSIEASPGAEITVYDKTGFGRTEGNIAADDRLVVKKGDMERAYYLSLINLVTGEIASGYIAYITSDEYGVDQVTLQIDGVKESTSVADFLSHIFASEGAETILLDSDGNVKTSGDIAEGDMVNVTSPNGELTVTYVVGTIITGAESISSDHILLYPNPTNSVLHIEGLNPGSRIQVYNVMGAMLRDVYSQEKHSVMSLDSEADGLYFIVISDRDNTQVGRYKVIKR